MTAELTPGELAEQLTGREYLSYSSISLYQSCPCPARRPPQTVSYSYPGYLGGNSAVHGLCDYAASNLDNTGVVRQYNPTRIRDITDGTANTLLVGEKRLNLANLGQPQGDDNEGYTCGWNEDTVRYSSQRPQPDFIGDPSLHGGKLFGSSHLGTFNCVLADGGVRLVSYSVSQSTFKAFGTVAEGVPFNPNDL